MRQTQNQRLREFFERQPCRWIPLPEILALGIAQYGTRIKELREDKKRPMTIPNKILSITDGQKHTAFMYIPNRQHQHTFAEVES